MTQADVFGALAFLALAGCNGVDGGDVEAGARAYDQYCALCHGDLGQGYANDNANALSNQQFLSTATDAFLRAAVERGRPGTPMSAWSSQYGGPLSSSDVDDLLALLRSWQTAPDAERVVPGDGSTNRGQAQYSAQCAGCHGDSGEGVTAISLSNPVFLDTADDAFLRAAITGGRQGTPMKAWGDELTGQAIDDLVALLRSWAKPPGELIMAAVPPGHLGDAIQNPDGPEPTRVAASEHYVSVADLAADLEAGARIALIDARATSDYVQGHLAGAASLPFYDARRRASEAPEDVWIVTYCGCPHAAADTTAAALTEAGRTMVRALDEGIPGWLEQGHTLKEGPLP